MECKRLTIDGLILELDEAETQYGNNLQAHMISLDNLIGTTIILFYIS